MPGKQLYLFVEGPSDRRLITEIVKPILEERLSEQEGTVIVREYAHMQKGEMNNLLTTITASGDDYLLFADRDSATCVTAKKEGLQEKFSQLDVQKVIIVARLIESWYIAGLSASNARRLKVSIPEKTDRLTKSEFNAAMPDNFKSGTDFMREILKYFDIETAKRKNKSFRYFVDKYQLDS
jgi:hypothetical protein